MVTEIDRSTESVWFLAGQLSGTEPVRLVPVHSTPFHVGRRPGLALSIPRGTVSGLHAEIVADGDSLPLRDLKSTNGTFVNGRRITEETVQEEGASGIVGIKQRVGKW